MLSGKIVHLAYYPSILSGKIVLINMLSGKIVLFNNNIFHLAILCSQLLVGLLVCKNHMFLRPTPFFSQNPENTTIFNLWDALSLFLAQGSRVALIPLAHLSSWPRCRNEGGCFTFLLLLKIHSCHKYIFIMQLLFLSHTNTMSWNFMQSPLCNVWYFDWLPTWIKHKLQRHYFSEEKYGIHQITEKNTKNKLTN